MSDNEEELEPDSLPDIRCIWISEDADTEELTIEFEGLPLSHALGILIRSFDCLRSLPGEAEPEELS